MMDSRTFNRMTSSKDKVLNSIEVDISDILNDETLPKDVRAKLYSSAQSRFLKIEHPQWGEVTKPVSNIAPENAVAERPPTSILKTPRRRRINTRNVLPKVGEVVPDSNETELYTQSWTPQEFLENLKESEKVPIYVTPGHPIRNRRRKKIKFESFQ